MNEISPRRQSVAGAVLISVLCLWVYSPSIHGKFLLDDNGLLTHNKLVRASNGLARFWFSTDPSDYWPLTNSAFWLQWRLWGNNPTGYHATNLLLHLAAVFLLWAILRKLAIGGAYLAAALFAVHPVNVESIAWISQLKNALAMVFFLLSILWYLKEEEERSGPGEERRRGWGRWYWLSLLAFVLAMLSKGSVAVLPIVLLALVWWQRRRIGIEDFLRCVPFFVVSAALTAVNVWFQTHGKEIVVRDATLSQRLAGAGAVVWFYLAKAIAPIHLVFIYPNWTIRPDVVRWWLPLAAAVVMTLVLWRNCQRGGARWALPLFFAWGLFCVALLPVLGFADVGFMKHSLVADHYEHLALIAVVALIGAGWAEWLRASVGTARQIAMVVAIASVAALATIAWQQNRLYSDSIALYAATLQDNPECWLAHYNLGNDLTLAGAPAEAVPHFRKALELKPDDPEALANLGTALGAMGQTPEALEYFERALRLKPEYAPAESNLGLTLVSIGRPQEAMVHLQRAVELDPEYAEAELNLGSALLALGRGPEAVECFQKAIELQPRYAEAFYNLGNAAIAAGDSKKAIQWYQEALRIQPNYAEAHNNLGGVFYQAGRTREAIEEYRQALRIRPGYAEAHVNLGMALCEVEQFEQAIDQFQQAVQLRPDHPDAHASLGKALAKVGRPQEAVAEFKRAIQLRPDFAKAWMDLALAYAALKQPGEAIHAAETAARLAHEQQQPGAAEQIDDWLLQYRAEQASAPGAKSAPRRTTTGP